MRLPAEQNSERIWNWLMLAAVLINIPCLFNDIMEPDGALYASIAKQITTSNNWSHLYLDGQDWLDKPHLPFWAAAISFKIFGINAFAYKLPSFMCFLAGLYYTRQLAFLLFNNKILAAVSTILYGTALLTVLANYDVRAEGYLTAFVCAATFYLLKVMHHKSWRNILLAALFCAFAVMTKGIFIFIIIFAGFVLHWLLTKRWKQFINPAWYWVALFTFIFIIPELYCLWLQFDSQPQKIVFGHNNVSGIRFFFWDSQFGRFFNTGPIKGSGDISFFLHTTLWAYMPWSPLLVAAVIFLIRKRDEIKTLCKEFSVVAGSALFGFLLFSFSKFQLPHYIVTLFPYFSIMTAVYITSIQPANYKGWNIGMPALFVITLFLVITITVISKMPSTAGSIVLLTLSAAAFIFSRKFTGLQGIIVKGIITAALVSIFLNVLFYPKLLQYQSGMIAANWLQRQQNTKPVMQYHCNSYAFSFYNKTSVLHGSVIPDIFKQSDTALLYTSLQETDSLRKDGIATKVLFTTPEFHITILTPEFIQYKTRPGVTGRYVIAECINQKK